MSDFDAPKLSDEQFERLNDIWAAQANRLNSGWSYPMSGDVHDAYMDIEFLLGIADPTYPERYNDDEA